MEADSVPQKQDWLAGLMGDITTNTPFAILGSPYRGRNWDDFINAIPDALRHHINGNAVYNRSDATFVALLGEIMLDDQSQGVSSFDVRLAEVLIDDVGVSALAEMGYKEASSVSNFAGTLRALTPTEAPVAPVVHGARDYADWGFLSGACLTDCDIDLVVSDWGVGDGAFAAQVAGDVLGDVASVIEGLKDEASAGRFPFSKVVVVTPSALIAGELDETIGPQSVPVEAVIRNSIRPSSSWDLCSALPGVTSSWFMLTNAHHTISSPFKLPVRVSGETLVPVVPFVPSGSPYCGSVCQAKVSGAKTLINSLDGGRRRRFWQLGERGAESSPSNAYNHDIAELNAVYRTSTVASFCAELEGLTADSDAPTANAYFAYGMGTDSTAFESLYDLYRRDQFGIVTAFTVRPTIGARSRVRDDLRVRRARECIEAGASFVCTDDGAEITYYVVQTSIDSPPAYAVVDRASGDGDLTAEQIEDIISALSAFTSANSPVTAFDVRSASVIPDPNGANTFAVTIAVSTTDATSDISAVEVALRSALDSDPPTIISGGASFGTLQTIELIEVDLPVAGGPCGEDPCNFVDLGATCSTITRVSGVTTFSCTCSSGFEGPTCQDRTQCPQELLYAGFCPSSYDYISTVVECEAAAAFLLLRYDGLDTTATSIRDRRKPIGCFIDARKNRLFLNSIGKPKNGARLLSICIPKQCSDPSTEPLLSPEQPEGAPTNDGKAGSVLPVSPATLGTSAPRMMRSNTLRGAEPAILPLARSQKKTDVFITLNAVAAVVAVVVVVGVTAKCRSMYKSSRQPRLQLSWDDEFTYSTQSESALDSMPSN